MSSEYRLSAATLLLIAAAAFHSRPSRLAAAPPSGAGQPSAAPVLPAMQKMADAQLALYGDKPPADWISGAFYTGLVALYHAEGDKGPHLDAALKIADKYAWKLQPGGGASRNIAHADDECFGQLLIDLAVTTKDLSKLDPLKKQLDEVIAGFDHPENARLWANDEKRDGAILPWWWCDAFFMAPPTLTRLSAVTGDKKYIDAMDKQWWITTDRLYDKTEHLFYRDNRFIPQKTPNGKKVFWGRGNGWVIAGLANVLTYMPKDYPTRPKYEALFKDMCEKLASLQGPDGMWRVSLLDPESAPPPESSASAFYCYAFLWGINNHLLDKATFEPAALKAWAALNTHLRPDGLIGSVQKVSDRPESVDEANSMPYAVGGYLLSGAQVIKLRDGR
jgi:rhamnogalacturonyl hydrolase YesR